MLRIVLVVGGLRSAETLLLAIVSALDLVQIASEEVVREFIVSPIHEIAISKALEQLGVSFEPLLVHLIRFGLMMIVMRLVMMIMVFISFYVVFG